MTERRGGSARLAIARRSESVSLADELFFSLDGQQLVVADAQWRVEVCGVHSTDTEHWVQLNLSGPLQTALTIRSRNLDASSVLNEVSRCIERRYSYAQATH